MTPVVTATPRPPPRFLAIKLPAAGGIRVTYDPGTGVMAIAWGYMAARAVHAWIHLGDNRARYRLRAYFVSWLLLLALWICVAIEAATPLR